MVDQIPVQGYKFTRRIFSNIFIQPMSEAIDFFKRPITLVWGAVLISSSVFIIGGTIAHYYYKYTDAM